MEEFEKVYRKYFMDVYRYILSLTHDATQAEEITAETFFRALSAYSSFHQNSSIKSWLCSIARNIYIDQLRSAKYISDLSDTGMMRIPDPAPDPSVISHSKEKVNMIMEALKHLKEPYQTVFRLRYIHEYSFKAIGAKYGKSENWACVTCHRAKEIIRKEVKTYDQ